MEITIPLLVIAAMFIIGLINKTNQSAARNSAPEQELEDIYPDYFPQSTARQTTQREQYPLETIDSERPFSFDDEIMKQVVAEPESLESDAVFANYVQSKRVAEGSIDTVADKNDISNSEIKDAIAYIRDDSDAFDVRKAVIYTEIMRPKYL